MMPLDDTTPTDDDDARRDPTRKQAVDEPSPPMTEIWSSIGPGRVLGGGEGPPTIRPDDLTCLPLDRDLDPVCSTSEKDLPVTDTAKPANSESGPEALREELRVGVRMLQALDAQFTRAESLIRREEDAANRAEETIARLSRRLESIETGTAVAATIDADEIEQVSTSAIERINAVADDVARRLHDRLERFVTLDTRLDELDATLHTVERRLERLDTMPMEDESKDTTTIAAPTTSGSLSAEPRLVIPAPPSRSTATDETVAAIARLSLLIDRGEEVRRELRQDLEAICTASATLVEVVEQAATTERTLRGTIESTRGAEAMSSESPEGGWTVASILRRLADEFDAGQAGTSLATAAIAASQAGPPKPRPNANGVTPATPIELDLNPASATSSESTSNATDPAPRHEHAGH